MIRYIKTFEVIFSTNNLSGMHISTMWHSLNVLKYFCPLSVCINFLVTSIIVAVQMRFHAKCVSRIEIIGNGNAKRVCLETSATFGLQHQHKNYSHYWLIVPKMTAFISML